MPPGQDRRVTYFRYLRSYKPTKSPGLAGDRACGWKAGSLETLQARRFFKTKRCRTSWKQVSRKRQAALARLPS